MHSRIRPVAFLMLVVLSIVGCRDFDKPRDLSNKPRPYLPDYSIEEQGRRLRGRYSIPQDDRNVGPRTGVDRSTPVGW